MTWATDGGADAESAMKGALAKALKPPMLLNAILNLGPLKIHTVLKIYFTVWLQTILGCSVLHPLLPRPNASWKKVLGKDFSKEFEHLPQGTWKLQGNSISKSSILCQQLPTKPVLSSGNVIIGWSTNYVNSWYICIMKEWDLNQLFHYNAKKRNKTYLLVHQCIQRTYDDPYRIHILRKGAQKHAQALSRPSCHPDNYILSMHNCKWCLQLPWPKTGVPKILVEHPLQLGLAATGCWFSLTILFSSASHHNHFSPQKNDPINNSHVWRNARPRAGRKLTISLHLLTQIVSYLTRTTYYTLGSCWQVFIAA